MASTKWLHHRIWCGRLPHFHLLQEEELVAEQETSLLYFGSNEFASIRTQIRLKLKETPLINQSRRSASAYTSVLELLNQYLPYVLALKQYSGIHQYQQQQQQGPVAVNELLAVLPPLFYGFGSTTLSGDRFVGREHRMPYTLVVELVLTLFTMAQMQALCAEAQVEQAVRLQNDALLQLADRSWHDAATSFRRAAAFASEARKNFSSSDPMLGSILNFFHDITLSAQTVGHMCAMHRISTRVYFLIVMDETTERLARAVSAYARCAHTIAVGASAHVDELPDNEFTRQLGWLLKTYETRWKAVYYNCEQSVYQLDVHPDIAIHFADAILRLRIGPLPSYSHRHDSFFTRIAQELQLAHQGHLNAAMDEKKALLHACQQKCGTSWVFEERGKAHDEELFLRVHALSLGLNGGEAGPEKRNRLSRPSLEIETERFLEEHESATVALLERIGLSVNKAIGNRENGAGSSGSDDASQLATVDTGSMDRKRKKTMLGDLPAQVCGVVGDVAESSPQAPRYSSVGTGPSRSSVECDLKQDQLMGMDDGDGGAAVESVIGKAPSASSPAALLDALAAKKRPSSAQFPAKDPPPRDSGWVKMTVGDKTLHFEKVPFGGGASSSSHSPARRRNAVSMALADDDLTESTSQGRLKPRPSSSPSCLAAHKSKVAAGQDDSSGGGTSHGAHQTHMWVPMRGQCALCERRYMRHHLAGVVVMKRIFDLRRKWGMIIQDSKKFYAATALYAKAQVCLLCQEILLHEDEKSLQAFENEHRASPSLLGSSSGATASSCSSARFRDAAPETDDVGLLIYNSIVSQWHQQPTQNDECLEDVALNKRARQSSTIFDMDARNAVQLDATRCAHTKEELQPWWEVDLANYHVIHSVKIWLREEVSHLYNGSGSVCSNPVPHEKHATQRKAAIRPVHRPLRHLGMYPLHISISMKTGVGRDLDDILASCVSSHCVGEKAVPPIVWHAPPNSRGRFVRIQAEHQAILHIEKVHVFVASVPHQQQKLHDTNVRKAALRQQMKKAAFRASIIAYPAPHNSADVPRAIATAEAHHHGVAAAPQERKQLSSQVSSSCTHQPSATTCAAHGHPHGLVSTFFEPEQAEKKRMSRLYSRFKSLLDARSKYMMDELDQGRRRADD